MGRRFVIGDIHGAYRALIQCMERSAFDRDHDELICLGDVCDGWPETNRCIDELLRIKHLTYILGNHDTWLLKWMTTGEVDNIWYVQGGEATIMSYAGMKIPSSHIDLFQHAKPYFVSDRRLYVHAGILPEVNIEEQGEDIFLWDRTLARLALKAHQNSDEKKFTQFEEVFIGHTPTSYKKPIRGGEVWMMDTGAGWSGVLSMMDVASKECCISDNVPSLYPGIAGRGTR